MDSDSEKRWGKQKEILRLKVIVMGWQKARYWD
jgi:hypothetical protein